MLKIRINGKEHAALLTGGALLRFKREAGYDFLRHPERMDTEGIIIMAWAAVKSTAARDGESFDMTVEQMADSMSLAELNALGEWVKSATNADGEPDKGEPDDDSAKKKESSRE